MPRRYPTVSNSILDAIGDTPDARNRRRLRQVRVPQSLRLDQGPQRRVELNITEFIHNAYHYAEGLARFAPRIPVAPEAAPGLKAVAQDRLVWLDGLMGDGPHLAG